MSTACRLIASYCLGLSSAMVIVGCTQDTAAPAPSAHQAVETYARGVSAYKSGNRDDAIRSLQQAIQQNPQVIMPRVMLGGLQKDAGNYQAAAEQYQTLTQLDPYCVDHHLNLGISYQMIQRLRDAEKSYLAALRLDPKNFGANMYLGLVYVALGEPEKAVHYTDVAARLDPKSAQAYSSLAAALDARGDYPLAESAYRKSLELAPYEAGTLLNYASNLLAQRKPQPAIAVLTQAQKLQDTPYTHKRIGDALAMDNKLPEAIAEYENAIQKNPKYYAAMNECAQVLIQQYRAGMELDVPKRDRALALWQKSLEISPNQPQSAKVKAALQEWERRMFSN